MNSDAGMLFNALPAATSSVRTWFETGTFTARADPAVLDVDVPGGPEPPETVALVGAVVDVVVPLDPLGELEQAANESAPNTATAAADHDRRCTRTSLYRVTPTRLRGPRPGPVAPLASAIGTRASLP